MNSSVNQTKRFSNGFLSDSVEITLWVYSSFEKGGRKKCARDNPERWYGIWSIHCSWHSVAVEPTSGAFLWHSQTYVHGRSCERTVNSKPRKIPFGNVACTFSNSLSRNSRVPKQLFTYCWIIISTILTVLTSSCANNG